MNQRYNVCTPRARKDKTFWHSVGSAFEDERGITVYLDSSPYPDAEGRVVLKLFAPRENNQQRGNDGRGERQQSYDDSDSIPF